MPGGIFQQWVQLHHMRIEDLYVLLNTIHREFKYVAVWYSGSQGQILASDQPITLDWQRLKALAVSNPSRDYISSADIYRIPYTILLDQSNVRQFTSLDTLDALVGHDLGQSAFPRLSRIYLDGFLNSDFYPYLEYATPRGNAIEHLEFLNLAYLRKLVGSPVVIPFRNLPPADLPLAKSLIDYRIGACDHLESASGPASLQAGPGFFAGCAPAYAIGTEASQ